MAKKKTTARRVPRGVTPRMYGDGKPSSTAQPTAATSGAKLARPSGGSGRMAGTASRGPVVLSQEYRYVLGDLRRLGILAAATFAVLIVLGLIIR